MARKQPAFLVLCFLLSYLACAQQNPGNPGTSPKTQASVVGSVKNAQTGRPLDDVHVRLIHSPSLNRQGVDLIYGAMSKHDGSFSIIGIQAGSYEITVDRYGFVLAPSEKGFDKSLTIRSGQQVKLDVEMIAVATISGEVLDEYGDPLSGMNLLAEPLDDKRVSNVWESRQTSTDDRGRFRLQITPGKYRLKTQFLGGMGTGLPEIRTDGTQPGSHPEVYFPGTPSAAMAAVIEARAGKESSGVNFRLTSSPLHSISGEVANFPENAFCQLNVSWGLTADRMRSGSNGQFLQEPGGKLSNLFLLGNLQPGFYHISARCDTKTEPLFSQDQLIDLTTASVDNVSLQVAPGVVVSGTLMPRNLWPGPVPPRITFQSLDAMSMFMPLESDVGPDGSFTIKSVPRGGYRVFVRPLPENAFIESVQNSGSKRTTPTFDISEGSTVRVVVSDQGAEISGIVRDDKAASAPLLGMVFLKPDGEKFKIGQAISGLIQGQGRYVLKAIPPGSYRLIAVEFAVLRSEHSDDLIDHAIQSSEIVVVQPKDRITKDLKAFTAGGHNAANQ